MAARRRLAVARAAFASLLSCALFAQEVDAATLPTDGSYTSVLAAYAVSVSGDVLHIPSGTHDWSTNLLTVTHPIGFLGDGRDTTNIVSTNVQLSSSDANAAVIMAYAADPDATGEYRFTGIRFFGSYGGGTGGAIKAAGASGGPVGVHGFGAAHFIVEDCTFDGYTDATSAISIKGQWRGVVGRNDFVDCNYPMRIFGENNIAEWIPPAYPYTPGSSDNFYFETNTIRWTPTMLLAGGNSPGWIESGQSSRVVKRYNHYDFTNVFLNTAGALTAIDLWDVHGAQSWSSNGLNQFELGSNTTGIGQTSSKGAEIYGNEVLNFPGLRVLVFRGGFGVVLDNPVTTVGPSQSAINMQQYGHGDEDASCGGVPDCKNGCNSSITPSANGTVFDSEVKVWSWNNTKDGSNNPMVNAQNGCPNPKNTDWFTDDDGGIVKSTSAPPGSTSETAGKGYAYNPVTTAVSTDPDVVQQTILYTSNGSAYVEKWRPYTYPHPELSTTTPTPTPSPSHTGFFGLP